MNKEKPEAVFFDFDIRYDRAKDKPRPLNTECILTKKETQLYQLYTGLYFQNSYHNNGRCKWFDGEEEYVYEGKIYASDLHGYGRLIYPDHSTYEGLFYHNKRFGPGVVTYPNQLQDVGFWDGKYLIRLTQYLELEDDCLQNIPHIGQTLEGKLYMLKFKEVVPVIEKDNPVTILAKKFNLKPEQCEQLFSKCIRNYKSLFMHKAAYDKNFYTDPDECVVEVFEHYDERGDPVTSKITAMNLLAWNNEKKFIKIMMHTFRNRKYEKLLSFKIRNAVLPNRRDTFLAEGPIEEMSLKLLAACRNDDTESIRKLICEYDLYPSVSDCYGNTTVIYAALGNKREAIKTLAKLGAGLNLVNDECISALMLCILHYIAIKNDTNEANWEDAFLTQSRKVAVNITGRIWPTKSTASSSETSSSQSRSSLKSTPSTSTIQDQKGAKGGKKIKKDRDIKVINKKYIFNLIYKAPKDQQSKRAANVRKKFSRKRNKCIKEKALANILETIRTLIQCGADVNACSVPYPPLISVLFSHDQELMGIMLENQVTVNQTTAKQSGELNPLHIVCAMKKHPNLHSIVDTLLKYGADVNARCNIDHWPETRDLILAGDPIEPGSEDFGKTPFHILAMRYDFGDDKDEVLLKIARMLVDSGADPSMQYLGHNALTLAILRKNQPLVEYLLNSFLVDPNGPLGYNMGVPLTLFTLKKYARFFSQPCKIEALMNTLIKFGANPFNEIDQYECNAIEFVLARNEGEENLGFKYLQKAAASVLRRYIDANAFRAVLRCVRHGRKNPLINNQVKYLNLAKAVNITQIFLDHKVIPPNYDLCVNAINFLQMRLGRGKVRAELVQKSAYPPSTSKRHKIISDLPPKTFGVLKFNNKTYILDFNQDESKIINPFFLSLPEIDRDHLKYRICYSCLQREEKHLQICPHCRLVYFCSILCNRKENESGQHPCDRIFYTPSLISMMRLTPLLSDEREEREKRREMKRQKEREERLSKRKSPRKSPYGILDLDTGFRNASDMSIFSEIHSNDSDETKRRKKSLWNASESRKKVSKRDRERRNRIREFWRRYRRTSYQFRGRRYRFSSLKIPHFRYIKIGFKKSLRTVLREDLRYRSPELKPLRQAGWFEKMKCKIALSKRNIDLMLRTARRINLELIPSGDGDESIDPCEPFGYKFWQLFLPYCVIQDGELYYRSNDLDILYKLPYTFK